jgi:RHS repeat-associated protein
VQVSYSSSVNFPNTNNPPPKQVVTMVARSDGLGGSSTTTYSYSGGLMDRQERRFLGFREVTQTLPPCVTGDCPSVHTTLKQDLPSAGKPESVERRDGAGQVLLKSEYAYTTTLTPPRTSQLTEEWSYTYDLLGAYKRTRAAHQYDAYGNRTQTIFYGDADVSGDEKTVAWSFVPNTLAPTYIVDRVSSGQQFAGLGTAGNKLSEQRHSYDGLGWGAPPTEGYATRLENWLDTEARFVGRTLHYDSWGNLDSVLDETNRPTTIGYDTTYHVFPIFRTNGAVGETETATWDMPSMLCGIPSERRDANLQPTTFQADNYCRPSVTNYPLGGFEIRSYPSLGTPGAQHVRVEMPSPTPGDGSGNDYVLEYFDGLGRPYKTIKKGTPSRPTIRKDTAYNVRGGIASETAPYYEGFETPRITSYSYDALDRLTVSLFPDGNDVEKTYGIWSETTFDEHNHPATTRFDAYGRKAQTEQVLGGQTLPTAYGYDLLGRMTGITDPVGITWSWTFDSLGRNTERIDPDSGTWAFIYDDAGRLVHQTDAKGQQTEFDYDAAGRPWTKTNSVETVTIGHSEQRDGYFNIGRTTSVSVTGRTLTMDYDAAGRAVKQRRTLDGFEYVAERRYDSAGRLRGITYPDGDSVGTPADPLGYDRAGRLYSVPGILTEVLYDGAGRPMSQRAADNGPTHATTTKMYSTRGFLTDISTTGAGGTIQNLHYQPDPAGLVDSVTSPFPNEDWDYTYDELHRLTSAQSSSAPSQDQTFQYDSIGRITYNSKVGSYTYLPNGWGHSHGPETVNGTPYSYDSNGNLYAGGGRAMEWNPDNLLTQVTKDSKTTTFTYDGLGERVKKTSTSTTSIYPLGDDYEITDGAITKYVSVTGLGVIAKKVGTTTFWLHTDRLGSIQAITDASGTVVQRRSYRPYGDTIEDNPSPPPLLESRGFVDQRRETETGLTYLHARFYDPALGIFISPDPLGPHGGLTEYAYGLGDPINRSDRSGLYSDGPLEMTCTETTEQTGYQGEGGAYVGEENLSNQTVTWTVCTTSARPSGLGGFPGMMQSPLAAWLADWRSAGVERRQQRQQQQQQQGQQPPPQEQPGTPQPPLPGPDGGNGNDTTANRPEHSTETSISRVLRPDFAAFNLNVGGLFGWSGQVVVDKNLDVYLTLLGGNVGKSLTVVSGSLTLGWARLTPGATLSDFLSAGSVSPGLGYWGGVGRTWNDSGSAWQFGLVSPQGGVSAGYSWCLTCP